MNNGSKSQIPTDEEFERASRWMEEQHRGLEEARQNVLHRLRGTTPLDDLYLFVEGEKKFRGIVCLTTHDEVTKCEMNGVARMITDCVREELERGGRGARDEITLAMEFDSDDKYKGRFWRRLR